MTYDWLFFEQYLSAGLIMPIAMDMYSDDEKHTERLKRAKRIKICTRIFFYTVLVGWFVAATWSGNFIVRLSMCGIYVYICVVYLFSLRSIKKALEKLESKNEKEGLLQNKCLVRGYFVIYMLNMIVCLAVLIILLPNRENFTKVTVNKEGCKQVVAFVVFYELLILSYTVRIAASCYMSYKQCRSIKDCNTEFICVLNSSIDSVQMTLAQE